MFYLETETEIQSYERRSNPLKQWSVALKQRIDGKTLRVAFLLSGNTFGVSTPHVKWLLLKPGLLLSELVQYNLKIELCLRT